MFVTKIQMPGKRYTMHFTDLQCRAKTGMTEREVVIDLTLLTLCKQII
jgi:hypothetical protein